MQRPANSENRTYVLFGERSQGNGEEDVCGIFTFAPPSEMEKNEAILRLELYAYRSFRIESYSPKSRIPNLRGKER